MHKRKAEVIDSNFLTFEAAFRESVWADRVVATYSAVYILSRILQCYIILALTFSQQKKTNEVS